MRITDEEKHAAGMVLDDTPQRDTGHDLDRQMQETVEALRAWREMLNDLPAPVIPKRPPLRITILQNLLLRWKPIAAAAATILLAIGAWYLVQQSRPTPPVPEEPAWLAQAPPPQLGDTTAGTISFDAAGDKGRVGSRGARPGEIGGPPPSGASGTDTINPAVEAFIGQFDFAFRIPQTLPVGWTFRRARPISASRVQLIYQRDEHLLSVLLWKSDKQDGGSKTLRFEKEKRMFTVIHTGGIALAFEGGQSEPKIWKKVAASFAPEKKK